MYDSIDIILFVFIIGGCIGILNETGAFNAGIAWLSKKMAGREYLLIIFLIGLIAFGGTTFGFAEEIITLFPILMLFFLTAGYDVMTCIATVYLGSMIGTMYSTINPFSVGIASNAAGISLNEGLGIRSIALLLGVIISIIYVLRYAKKIKEDPSNSICYAQYEKNQAEFQQDDPTNLEFTRPMKLTLLTFAITFLILIWGLVMYRWWFDTMTALFLAGSIVMIFVSGRGIDAYVSGAADMLSVALIIGVARGVNIVLEQGMASDTILYFFSNIVKNMNPILFIVFMLLIFIVLGFFILSSSGLAMVNITYDRWVKFIWPLMVMISALNLGMLMVQVLIG